MPRIDTKPFVEMGMYFRLPDYCHFDGCELSHTPCAILYLAGALDAAQDRLDEYAVENARLRAQLEHAKQWIPEWAWADDPIEDEAWKNL